MALDMAPELTRAVTNVVCSLCFNSSYRRGDPEFEAMLEYSQGIVDTVAKESLVDIFPWLQVSGNIATTWASCFWNRRRGWNASHKSFLLQQVFSPPDLPQQGLGSAEAMPEGQGPAAPAEVH